MAHSSIRYSFLRKTTSGLTMDEYLVDTHRNPNDHTDWARIPFAATAVLGGAFLIYLKWMQAPQWGVTIIAISLIFTYAGVVHYFPKLRLREDQLGDNCYYLGFLFTLLSLSWALWEFAHSGKEEDIVANFGLALGSTIAGVLLRVSINQARKDVLETETDARMALAQSVTRLRVEIDDAVLALSAFHKQTEQIAADAIRASADRAAKALDESIAKVGNSSTSALEKIETAFADFSTHAQQLNEVSAGTVKGMKSLLNRIEKIEAPNDMLLRRLEPALAAVDEVSKRLRDRIEADDALLAAGEERTRALLQRYEELQSGLRDVGRGVQDSATTTGQIVRELGNVHGELRRLLEATGQSVGGQIKLAEETRAEVSKLITANGEHLASLTASFTKYNDAMAIELERCRRMVAGTGTALADMADSLADRIEERPTAPGQL